MDIYHDAGVDALVDLDKARHELKASAAVNHEGTRRAIVAEITAAALLDIACSLRPIGAEAASAMRYEETTRTMSAIDEPDVADETRDFFVVGDLVHLRNDTEPGEITKLLFTEDELAADVDFASGYAQRHYVRDLVRIIESETSDGLDAHVLDELRKLNAEADGEPDIDEGDLQREPGTLDDLDEDFAAPTSALDVLTLPDEKPAKKKKGGK